MRTKRWSWVGVALLLAACSQSFIKSYARDDGSIAKIRTIAVLPFACSRADVGIVIADSLSGRLVASSYLVIERGRLESLLREKSLSISGIVDNPSLVVGLIKGVDALIVGSANAALSDASFSPYGGGVSWIYVPSATARMIAVETGDVLMAVTADYGGLMGLTPAALGQELAKRFLGDER